MKPNLKLTWLRATVLLLALAACGGGQTTAPEPTLAPEGQPAATLPAEGVATLPPPVVEGEVLPTPTLAAPTEGGEAVPAEQPAAEAEVSRPVRLWYSDPRQRHRRRPGGDDAGRPRPVGA